MFRRDPNPRDVLEGKYEYTEPIEYLQADTMAQGDFRHRLCYRGRDIGDNQQHQDAVDGTRGWFPAASVLKDLENTLARYLSTLQVRVH